MEKERKQIAKITVFITSLFVIFLSVTYAFINQTIYGTKRQVITTGSLQIELEEDKEIKLENAMPMYDEVGKLQDAFNFRLINNSNYKVDYTLYLADITDSKKEKLSYQDVKYYLIKDYQDVKLELLSERTDQIIDSGVIEANRVNHYSLRLWIDSNVEKNESISHKMLSFQLIAKVTEHIPENYTITYHTGTDEVIEAQTKIENEDMTLPSPTISRDNRIFLGWSKEENGTPDYPINEPFIENISADLYAVWGIDNLYNYGNQYVFDTGGWTYTRTFVPTTGMIASGNARFEANFMYWEELSAEGNCYDSGSFQTTNLLNLTNAKNITITYHAPVSTPWNGFYPYFAVRILDVSNKILQENIYFIPPGSALETITLDLIDIDLSSVRFQIECVCGHSGTQTLALGIYNVSVHY